MDWLVGCCYPGSCYSSFCSLVLLTPHNTLGIIYYTLIEEISFNLETIWSFRVKRKTANYSVIVSALWCYYLALALHIIVFDLMALKNKLIREQVFLLLLRRLSFLSLYS